MGKRKSKSGKQKQTKKKGGSNSNSNSILGKNSKKSSAQSSNDIRILCSLPKPRANKQQYNGLQSKLQPQTKQQNEKEDFDRQMNSLVERSRAAASAAATSTAANSTRRKSGRRRKHIESKLLMTMKPASFSLEKSTKQLYEETIHQMGQIMATTTTTTTTINNTIPGLPPPTTTITSSLARAAAAIPSSERTPIISNVASHRTSFVPNPVQIAGIASIGTTPSQKQTNRNSFSALTGNDDSDDDDDDDDDDSINENAEIARANTIRFAPASFAMASSNNNNNNNNNSSSNCNNSTSQLLPTKTPPTTPTTSHHFRHAHSKRATSLFSTIAEEEIEELQYQRQTGTLDHGGMSRHLNSSYIQATAAVAADDDDDEL